MELYTILIGDGSKRTAFPKSIMLNYTTNPYPKKFVCKCLRQYSHSARAALRLFNNGLPNHNLKFNSLSRFMVVPFLDSRILNTGILPSMPTQIDTLDIMETHLLVNNPILRMRRFQIRRHSGRITLE